MAGEKDMPRLSGGVRFPRRREKRGAPGLARRSRKMGARARKRENAFKDLQGKVESILRVAPAVDQSIIKELKKLQEQLDQRKAPPKPKREQGA